MNKDRLNVWREISKVAPEAELDEIQAGRDAEKSLKTLFDKKFIFSKFAIFSGKRVPYFEGKTRKRYETDLILLSHKQLSVIEVKNWSGELNDLGNTWKQTRRSGQTLYHENFKKKNADKLDKVIAYLEKQNCRIPNIKLSKIVFFNPRLKVDKNISTDANIITFNKLEKFISQQKSSNVAERLIQSVLEFCIDQENSGIISDGLFNAISNEDFQRCVDNISDLRNFDLIELHGGRMIAGDAYSLKIKDQKTDISNLESGKKIEVICMRNKLISLAVAMLGKGDQIRLGAPYENWKVAPSDGVIFHEAGETKAKLVPFKNIVRIIKG